MLNDEPLRISHRRALLSAALLLLAACLLLAMHGGPVPGNRSVPALPADDIDARKQAFIRFLRPIIRHHNGRIRRERAWLLDIADAGELGWLERRRFRALAERYDVDVAELSPQQALRVLRRRADVIPEALVLVQAAKESGWGRSRFARDGNALFGEWCYSRGCGIVPADRAPGRTHEVRAFDSVHDAVGSYMDNLNSHRSYVRLRIARETMRAAGEPLSALRLAEYLSLYSERREDYVREVQAMIVQNGLEPG